MEEKSHGPIVSEGMEGGVLLAMDGGEKTENQQKK
jgi:hypothetical protein